MLVRLHGFTGTGAPPLLGHHPSLIRPGTFAGEVERLHALLAPLAPVHLVGYSMGARLALGLLARDPTPFVRATFVSLNPGLRSDEERRARVAADERWVRVLQDEGLDAFAAAWDAQPMFAGRRRRFPHHDAAGLVHALRGLGLGAMPDLWPELAALRLPVTFVAGALDEKFVDLATRAAALTPGAGLRIVPGAGHDVQEIPS